MSRATRPLEGRCALITGSVQGLGLAAAERFAAAGCHLVLSGFADDDMVSALQRTIEMAHGVQTIHSAADLQHPSEIETMCALARDTFGHVDILVNNAVVRHTAPVEDFPAAAWDAALAVNLTAAFHTIRLLVPGMKARNWGRIVNVSSIYGLTGAADRIAYVTTKTALIGLTRAVALETATFDITCNAVCPGTTRTPIHEAAVERLAVAAGLTRADAETRYLSGKQPTRRLIDADSVAALMVFLCSPEGRDITGAALPVDGGWGA